MNLLQELVKAGMTGRGRRAEQVLGPSCERKTSLGVGWRWSWAVHWVCSEAEQSAKGMDGAWPVGRCEAEDNSGSQSYPVSP